MQVKIIAISSTAQLDKVEAELRTLRSVSSKCDSVRINQEQNIKDTTTAPEDIKNNVDNLKKTIFDDIIDLQKVESYFGSNSLVESALSWSKHCDDSMKDPCLNLSQSDDKLHLSLDPIATHLDGTLNCPYIVSFYDSYFDLEKGSVCLVLEYMGRGSLQNLIDDKRLASEMDIAVVSYSVLCALEELSRKNLLHRDIKPSNILIRGDGAVKLSDFGITSELDDENFQQTFTGTMCYMSPERIRGEKYGKVSDIWSLGISLLVLITGRSPFAEVRGFWNILDSFQKGAPSITMRGTATCSSELNDFLDMCLLRDPAERPDATSLLQSRFIQNAIANGILCPPLQPMLSGSQDRVISVSKVDTLVTAVLDWHPDHLNDMIFLVPSTNLDCINVEMDLLPSSPISISSICDSPKRSVRKKAADVFVHRMYSSKAVERLALVLDSTFFDVMRIIMTKHIESKPTISRLYERAVHKCNIKNGHKISHKEGVAETCCNWSCQQLADNNEKHTMSAQRCNPLFPYICSTSNQGVP